MQEKQVTYWKEYRRMGFGRLADRRYYSRHKTDILLKKRKRYNQRREGSRTEEDNSLL